MPILFSITGTCRRHGMDRFASLRDVLVRLSDLKPRVRPTGGTHDPRNRFIPIPQEQSFQKP